MFVDTLSAHARLEYKKFFSEATDLVRRVLLIPDEDLRKEVQKRIFFQSNSAEGQYIFTIDRAAVSDISLVEATLMRIMARRIPKNERRRFLAQPTLAAISELKKRLVADK
jgi:hypothetical protein